MMLMMTMLMMMMMMMMMMTTTTVQVAKLLVSSGDVAAEGLKLRQRLMPYRTLSEDLFDTDGYTTSRYLNDMSRHKKLAMEL